MSEPALDWSCHSPSFLLGWGLPSAALALSGAAAPDWMPVIWPLAFLWMSIACAVNASRCGRVHCYFTGVFFLVMAVVRALYGFDLVPLGRDAWPWIGGMAIVGGVGLTVFSEMIWGRYRRGGSGP